MTDLQSTLIKRLTRPEVLPPFRITERDIEILRVINQGEKIGMLLVEQNAAMALALADHAYLLETGRVVMSGAAEAIRSDESIRRSYLGY